MSSTISTAEVERVAGLARIALTPEEVTAIAADLDVIASAVARVSEVATPGVPATSHPIPLTNVLREDVVTETIAPAHAQACAPAVEDDRYLVPQILEED